VRPYLNFLPLVLLTALAGCGGSPGGTSSAVTPSASRGAVAPESSAGDAICGFDAAGLPTFAAVGSDRKKWTVYRSKDEPLYDIPVAGASDSRPGAVSGKFVVGTYDLPDDTYGVLVATRGADGTVTVAAYPGYGLSACDGGRALLFDAAFDGDNPPRFLLNLATGAITPEPVPAGYEPVAMRGRFAVCVTNPSGGALVYDVDADTSVSLQAAEGSDGKVWANAVNSKGQALGLTFEGDRKDLRLWSASGVPGAPLDSVTGGYLDAGWLSDDARRLTYDKVVDGSATAYMQVGSVVSVLRTDAFALGSLRGLNPKGTIGFGLDSDLGANVAVSVSYR